ncbi:MAG: hypothetical protein NC483_06260 [Ruminococcus sp.]|nr:hypothetical protein [Ruminococcus sp.]
MKFNKINSGNKKIFLYGIICVVALTITVTLLVSKANYRVTASIPIASGTVKSSPYDFNIISMYISDDSINYEETNIMPNSGYAINEEKSYCYIGTKDNIDKEARVYTNSNGEHIISNLIKGDKCILYFDKLRTMEELLANYYTDKRVRTSENKDFNIPYGETTAKTVFSAEDNDGTSYYFAGNPTDNWVEFGGYYWRIIRVNGNGSIRLIYQGRTKDENGKKLEPQITGEETQIGTSQFNTNYTDNKYVGYKYDNNETPSTINTYLNDWYENKATLTINDKTKIDLNVGFCGDRTPSSTDTPTVEDGLNIGDGLGGTGTTTTYYGAYMRLAPKKQAVTSSTTTVTPSLKCLNSDDLYMHSGANPVGLITADEVAYGGLAYGALSSGNYLDTGQTYWTISPSAFLANIIYAHAFAVESGYLGNLRVIYLFGVRPVINLRSDVKLIGNGTISNPYKVI